MENILIPIGVVGIVFGTIYKLFALFVRRKERIMLIEKINDANVDVLYGKKSKNALDFSPLTWGTLFVGLGLGLLAGFIICSCMQETINNSNMQGNSITEVIYGASLLLFGGSSLILSYFLEDKFGKKEPEDCVKPSSKINFGPTHNENVN